MLSEGMNSSSQVLSNWWLIPMFLYQGLLTISQCKALMTQCFCILTYALNYLSCSNDLPPQTTFTTLSIGVVSDDSKSSNGPGFCGKSTEYPRIPLFNLGLKLLLGLNFKIVITGYTRAITASLTNVRLFNILR